jgi:hypothetical protein
MSSWQTWLINLTKKSTVDELVGPEGALILTFVACGLLLALLAVKLSGLLFEMAKYAASGALHILSFAVGVQIMVYILPARVLHETAEAMQRILLGHLKNATESLR